MDSARRARYLVLAAAVAAVVGTVLAGGAGWWWVLELFTHFRVQYLLALALGAALCVFTKRWRLAAVFGCFAAFTLSLIAPLYLKASSSGTLTNGTSVRLMLANVHIRNRNHSRFLQLVRDVSPDVIVVLEVGAAWLKTLETLADEYPHRIAEPREDSFGLALLSRLPVDELQIREIGPAGVPSVIARIECSAGTTLQLIGTHPLPPVDGEYAALRNDQLHDVGRFAAKMQRPTMLVGDLNTTSWSPVFRELVAASGLRDSRRGFGTQPSWPGRLAMIGIPIDHILVSPDVVVERRDVGPAIGSDHRPLIVEVRIPSTTETP